MSQTHRSLHTQPKCARRYQRALVRFCIMFRDRLLGKDWLEMAEKWIYWFEELSSADNDRVGKKCANLGEMTQLGMRVPPGFAISVDGYEKFMEQSGAGEEIRKYVRDNLPLLKNVQGQVEAGRYIRQLIESRDMPADMEKELHADYAELEGRVGMPGLAVAVRSSGAVSMPGQMETYLNVRGAQEVTRKVIKVWGSAFTTRAIAFRLEKGMQMEKAPIGVAVPEDGQCEMRRRLPYRDSHHRRYDKDGGRGELGIGRKRRQWGDYP